MQLVVDRSPHSIANKLGCCGVAVHPSSTHSRSMCQRYRSERCAVLIIEMHDSTIVRGLDPNRMTPVARMLTFRTTGKT